MSVKERPIIFSGEMVNALLSGRKTMTRRVFKDPAGPSFPEFVGFAGEESDIDEWITSWSHGDEGGDPVTIQDINERPGQICPFGCVGDVLWVRETFRTAGTYPDNGYVYVEYKAGGKNYYQREDFLNYSAKSDKWKPSIFMPRWASRLALRITDIRVERVQSISNADAMAEGVFVNRHGSYQVFPGDAETDRNVTDWADATDAFRELWDSINFKRGCGWNVNPWCWALSFEVVK